MRTDNSIRSNFSSCSGFCANSLLAPWLSWLTDVCPMPTSSKNSNRDFGGVLVGLYPWWWLPGDVGFPAAPIIILVMEADSFCELWKSSPKHSTKQIVIKGLLEPRCFGDPDMIPTCILSLGTPRPVEERVLFPIAFHSIVLPSTSFHSHSHFHSLSGGGSILASPWRMGLGGGHSSTKGTLRRLSSFLRFLSDTLISWGCQGTSKHRLYN